ncbi:MAG: flagellar biosynthetic protein FliR [Steroidobacter sp.]
MITVTLAQLTTWISQYFWPFVRIAGCIMVAPMIGTSMVPPRMRVILSIAITILVAPLIKQPDAALLSGTSLVITVQQLIIGLGMGLAIQLIFDAVVMGGQLLANTMGLSFAVNVDPLHGASTPVLGQFYTIIVALTFFGLNGHLMLIDALAQSFRMLPLGTQGLGNDGLWTYVHFGSVLFSGALMIALPGLAALLIVNFAFGVMSRAAPTLNLFAVGFPASLALGLIIIMMGLPAVQSTFVRLLNTGWQLLATMLGD